VESVEAATADLDSDTRRDDKRADDTRQAVDRIVEQAMQQQDTTVDTTTTTTRGTQAAVTKRRFDFPLSFVYNDQYHDDGSETLEMRGDQGYARQRSVAANAIIQCGSVKAERQSPMRASALSASSIQRSPTSTPWRSRRNSIEAAFCTSM